MNTLDIMLSIYEHCVVPQECYLENDWTSMFHTAKSLMTLQALYGIIPNIYGKGQCAKVSGKTYFITHEWNLY